MRTERLKLLPDKDDTAAFDNPGNDNEGVLRLVE